MATVAQPEMQAVAPDRQALIRLAAEIDTRSGIFSDQQMSITKLRELMQADGVRPEDNGASSELMRMRYGSDWDKE